MGPHPLAALIVDAADGRFPDVDGGWQRVPPWRPGLEAIVAFTGHAVLALAPHTTLPRPVDGLGGAHDPRLVAALAADGWIDSLDVLLVAHGTGGPPVLVPRPDLAGHSRAAFAHAIRDDAVVLGRPDGTAGLAVLGRGIAGLPELSVELPAADRGARGATGWIRDALASVPAGAVVVAAVAPGNAASLRAFLAAGFAPIGSVQLFTRASSTST